VLFKTKNRNMKQFLLAFGFFVFAYACSNNTGEKKTTETAGDQLQQTEAKKGADADPGRGIGKFTNVEIKPGLDKAMADAGTKVYEVKCSSCHKLTGEKLVGPGWKDITVRRKAEWIMNFATNTDEMLSKDPEAMAQLEICLIRMPNQSLTDDDARHVYEFMRKNDGVK
jgi:cytochrome c551/c552